MYCPSCGAELAQEEMSYCNRCGANLRPVANQPAVVAPGRLVGATWAVSLAVGAVTLGGFALIFALVMAMITRGIKLDEGALALVIIALLVVLLIDWLLIRQLSRLISKSEVLVEAEQPKKQKQLDEKQLPRLNAPRQPVSSVTDHTTRTFEPLHRKRDTQH